MKKSRSKKALTNTIFGFLVEAAALVSGLILPRVILAFFGSSYNGLTSSIAQFISCISLLTSGIGGVTRAALFKPLADGDNEKISAIINQTQKFLKNVCLIFLFFIIGFSLIYPLVVSSEFDFAFTASLILIISLSTFAQYFFGLTYQSLLEADQKYWIWSLINMTMIIVNCALDCLLIYLGFGIHIVKLGSAIVYIIGPAFLFFYARKKYKIDKKIKGSGDLLKQRWDALGHEIASFVNNNTDVIVLTLFTSLGTVSVYTVYHAIVIAIRKIIIKFIDGFGPAFGDMYAHGEIELMKKNLAYFELIVFSLSTIVYSICFVTITPFVSVYTSGVTDANYYQPLFGFIITVANAFSCFRVPYQTVITAIGHFKQTRNGSFVEAALNIGLSIILVFKLGLVGIAIGTLVAAIFRTINFSWYLSKHVLGRSMFIPFKNIVIALSIGAVTYLLSFLIPISVTNYFEWIGYAVVIGLVVLLITIVCDFVFYKTTTIGFIRHVRSMFRRRG